LDLKKLFSYENKKFSGLFLNYNEYETFRNKFYRALHSKKEIIVIILLIGGMGYFMISGFFNANIYSIIYIAGYIIGQILWILVFVGLASGLYYVFTVFYYFFKFVPRDKLSIKPYLEWFDDIVDSQKVKSRDFKTTLYSFQHDTRIIGAFLFSFFFKVIILLVIADFAIYLPALIFPEISTVFAIAWLPGTLVMVLLFILIQFRIHSILKETKEDVLDGLTNLYNAFKLDLYQIFNDKNWEYQKGIMDQISFIKEEIAEIKKMGTWTYDFPAILKMVGAALVTLIPLLFEIF
jgi:hypothetical protein